MAYTPINWQTGDTITAEKMNKMDNGWAVESSQLFSESVTTTVDPEYPDDPPYARLEYSTEITADTIVVTLDGIDYTCDKQGPLYSGAGYPFRLMSLPFGNTLETDVAGTYEISVGTSSVETSASFQTAVNSVVDTSTIPMLCVSGTTTHDDMASAISSGRILCFQPYGSQNANISIITSVGSDSVTFFPTDSSTQTSFVDGVFVVSHT